MGRYCRLKAEEREQISLFLCRNISIRQMARRLGRSASTVCREIKKFRGPNEYRGLLDQRWAKEQSTSRRKSKTKLLKNKILEGVVQEKLLLRWSPVQIAQYLKIHYKNKD